MHVAPRTGNISLSRKGIYVTPRKAKKKQLVGRELDAAAREQENEKQA